MSENMVSFLVTNPGVATIIKSNGDSDFSWVRTLSQKADPFFAVPTLSAKFAVRAEKGGNFTECFHKF